MAQTKRNRCKCGKVMSKYAHRCNACDKTFYEGLNKVARAIVQTGKCPDCGSGLRRNLSLAGWWQCEQYGAESFRARPQEPSCNFQTFTE